MPTVGTSGETLARLQRREAAAAFSAKIKTKQSAWVSLSPLSQNLIKKETTMRWLYKLPDHLLIRSESPHLSKIKHFQSDASEREREREREALGFFCLFVFFFFLRTTGGESNKSAPRCWTCDRCVVALSPLHLPGFHTAEGLCCSSHIGAERRNMDTADQGAQVEPLLPTVRSAGLWGHVLTDAWLVHMLRQKTNG